jgi:hypothetical protein
MNKRDMLTPQVLAQELLLLLGLPPGKPAQIMRAYDIACDEFFYEFRFDGRRLRQRHICTSHHLLSLAEFSARFLQPISRAFAAGLGDPCEMLDPSRVRADGFAHAMIRPADKAESAEAA